MKITFLGTASGKPSKYRNVTSIAIELDDSEYILIDCGEGTQSQILKSDLKFNKISSIYITHLHGDHIFGLPGLLATINEYRKEPLHIYGPVGIKRYINTTLCPPYCSIDKYNIIVHEYNHIYNKINEIEYRQYTYSIESCFVTHREFCYAYKITQRQNNPKIDISKLKPVLDKYTNEINSLGFNPAMKIIQKLKDVKKIQLSDIELNLDDYAIKTINDSIIVCLDNSNASNVIHFFRNANTMIHECTYSILPNMSQDEIVEISKKAILYGHSTNRMAANNAKLLDNTNLIFTHFSNRYEYEDGKMKNETEIINDTSKYFDGNVYCADDFSIYKF
jgi:ribonuclease Z